MKQESVFPASGLPTSQLNFRFHLRRGRARLLPYANGANFCGFTPVCRLVGVSLGALPHLAALFRPTETAFF